jgi:hypothetical protein
MKRLLMSTPFYATPKDPAPGGGIGGGTHRRAGVLVSHATPCTEQDKTRSRITARTAVRCQWRSQN